LHLLAQSLALPADFFESYLTDPMPVLRLLHYPPTEQGLLAGQVGSGAHTDWGSITLLAQDAVGGLQVQYEGQWIDVPFVPDSFVVNMGDLMARWSNDRWRSALHRVLPQPSQRHRYSAAYFFDIDYHAVVSALPACVDATHPARYAPITAGQHIVEMYERTTVAAHDSDGISTVFHTPHRTPVGVFSGQQVLPTVNPSFTKAPQVAHRETRCINHWRIFSCNVVLRSRHLALPSLWPVCRLFPPTQVTPSRSVFCTACRAPWPFLKPC